MALSPGKLRVNGETLYSYNGAALTIANSPLRSSWISTEGISQVVPFFVFAGGTSTPTIEGGFDNSTADADFTISSLVSGTAVNIYAPFIRFVVTQTSADATKTKIGLKARA